MDLFHFELKKSSFCVSVAFFIHTFVIQIACYYSTKEHSRMGNKITIKIWVRLLRGCSWNQHWSVSFKRIDLTQAFIHMSSYCDPWMCCVENQTIGMKSSVNTHKKSFSLKKRIQVHLNVDRRQVTVKRWRDYCHHHHQRCAVHSKTHTVHHFLFVHLRVIIV